MDDEWIDAGPLADFVTGFRRAMEQGETSHVPCGSCTACCRTSHFVHVEADELDTLAHIPEDFLAPAPAGYPSGSVVLGFDGEGRCAMLSESGCGIWAHRPRVCRTYDCRVYPTAGLFPDQPPVAERARRWRFDVEDQESASAAASVQAAGRFLTEHFPDAPVAARAAAAVAVSDLFEGGPAEKPVPQAVAGEIRRRFGQAT